MSTQDKIIYVEAEGTLGFGDHTLEKKAKVEDFPYQGDLMKVKTSKEATRLEKNGLFVYESVPGTTVSSFKETAEVISFTAKADKDVQITLELAEETTYRIMINGEDMGNMVTNLGGKLSFSVETGEEEVKVEVVKA